MGGCAQGVSALGGVCLGGLLPGGSALKGSAPGRCLLWRGICSWGGGHGIPACTEADTPTPCGQTHTCKNITFTTLLWTVNIFSSRGYAWQGGMHGRGCVHGLGENGRWGCVWVCVCPRGHVWQVCMTGGHACQGGEGWGSLANEVCGGCTEGCAEMHGGMCGGA